MRKTSTYCRVLIAIVIAVAAVLFMSQTAFADWSLPVTISSGDARTNLLVGISSGATDGFDIGLDSPSLLSGGLDAYFYRPEWGVVVEGEPVSRFYKDIRGAIPQDFGFIVESPSSPVTIGWDRTEMPDKVEFWLYDHASAEWTDMRETNEYGYNSYGSAAGFTIRVAWGDMVPPSVPTGLKLYGNGTTLGLGWDLGTEADLAGYKIYWGVMGSGQTDTIILSKVRNYTIRNLELGQTYEISMSAYDKSGNESERTWTEYCTAAKTGYAISGRVVTSGYYALSGIGVTITKDDGTINKTTVSGDDGSYSFGGLTPGRYMLRCKSGAYRFNPLKLQVLNQDIDANIVGVEKSGKKK